MMPAQHRRLVLAVLCCPKCGLANLCCVASHHHRDRVCVWSCSWLASQCRPWAPAGVPPFAAQAPSRACLLPVRACCALMSACLSEPLSAGGPSSYTAEHVPDRCTVNRPCTCRPSRSHNNSPAVHRMAAETTCASAATPAASAASTCCSHTSCLHSCNAACTNHRPLPLPPAYGLTALRLAACHWQAASAGPMVDAAVPRCFCGLQKAPPTSLLSPCPGAVLCSRAAAAPALHRRLS